MYRHAHFKNHMDLQTSLLTSSLNQCAYKVHVCTCAYLCCLRISECVSDNAEVDLEFTTETKGRKPSTNSFG